MWPRLGDNTLRSRHPGAYGGGTVRHLDCLDLDRHLLLGVILMRYHDRQHIHHPCERKPESDESEHDTNCERERSK